MKIIIYIICFICFISWTCNKRQPRSEFYIVGNILDSILASNDSLFHIYEENAFKRKLDTFRFYGSTEPNEILIIEHECLSCYSITNLKYILMQYPDSARIYLFKYNYQDSTWGLTRTAHRKVSDIARVDSIMIAGINNSHQNDSVDAEIKDLIRYGTMNLKNRRFTVSTIMPLSQDSWSEILYLTRKQE